MEPGNQPSNKIRRVDDPTHDALMTHGRLMAGVNETTIDAGTTTTTTLESPTTINAIQQLPLPLAARIAVFNVGNTAQLAHLRHVSRSFYHHVLENIMSSSNRHLIRCPAITDVSGIAGDSSSSFSNNCKHNIPSSKSTLAFLEALTAVEGNYCFKGDLLRPDADDTWNLGGGRIKLEQLRIVEKANESLDDDNTSLVSVENVFEACDALRGIQSYDHFELVAAQILAQGLTRPLLTATTVNNDVHSTENENDDDEIFFGEKYIALLTILVAADVAQHLPTRSNDAGRLWLELPMKALQATGCIQPLRRTGSCVAPILSQNVDPDGSRRVVVLTEVGFDENIDRNYLLESLRLQSAWDTAQHSTTFVEGIVIVDDFYAPGRTRLCSKIDALAQHQETNHGIDFHPNTHYVVRNLVHPALYCHVDKVTTLHRPLTDAPPCALELDSHEKTNILANNDVDFWGRPYEDSVYQWLPTYFAVAEDGSCTIEDYINNLVPRDNIVHTELYRELEILFSTCLPFIESVYSYVRSIRPLFRNDGQDIRDWDQEIPPMRHYSLRGQKLQVITKIVDYELGRDQIHSGVWHVEGMSHEEIVLTALYIADRDESFHGADLAFKRTYLAHEANYLLFNMPQDRQTAVGDMIAIGLIPLGTVATPKGRLIVFPNSHVHQVSDMTFLSAPSGGGPLTAKRRIVVFFLVNPFRRIISTREVRPQQMACGGTMSHEDALAHRLQLMHERRHTKQDWNVREVELCEH